MAASGVNDKTIKRQRAIILSMTKEERRNPDLLKASRKKRIAAGAGMKVEDVNRLLKQHRQMADMMKAMGQQAGKRGPMAKMAQMFGLGGGMNMPSPEQIAEMQKQMGGPGAPGGMPKLPEAPPGLTHTYNRAPLQPSDPCAMPIYEYECQKCGHTLEALQKFSDKPLRECPECGRHQLKRLVSAPLFRLAGSGWYETDFKSEKERKRNILEKGDKEAAPAAESGTAKAEPAKAPKEEGTATAKARTVVTKSAKGGSGAGPKKKSAARPAAKPVAKRARKR